MEYPATQATVETLPNGLTLILDPDPSAPVVSAQIWVATGSIHEDRHLGAGISHFLEHMVFKGTRDFDGETLADTVQAAGGHWNAYTSFDRTVYFIDGPAGSLDIFLKCLTGLVFYPTLPESEFEKEKDVIRREIDMGLDDPDNTSSQLLFSTAFAIDPRRHPVIGHRHLFDRIRHGDLTGYHAGRYTTDRCFAVISGDFDPAAARASLTALTDGLLPGCGTEPLITDDPAQLGPRRAATPFAVPTSRISLAWKSPELAHPDSPAHDVLAAILGRGRASRLHRELRDAAGLALEISAFSWNNPGRAGLIAVSAEADPAHRDALIEATLDLIAALPATALDDDLAKAKRQIAASQFRSLVTASGRASDLASNWHEARDLDFTRRHLAAIQAVTAADVRRVANQLTRDRLILTIVDPPDAPAPAAIARPVRARADILTHTLPNGLRIALLPDPRVPLVHFQAAALAGLPSETPAHNGLNQLLASTLPKGTTSRSADEIANTLESLGASLSAATGNNALLVQAAGLAPDLAVIAEVFADVILHPAFPDDAIAREKASQLASLRESLTDPLHSAFRELRHAIFGGTGYGLDPLGSLDSLPQLGRIDLAAHHARHFNASNLVIAVAGDFDPDALLALLSRHFGGLPTGQPFTPPATAFHTGTDSTSRLPKKQAVVALGFPGLGVTDPDRHALAFIQEFATDMAGPLFTRIREELGLAYQVGATQFLGHDAGLFTFYLATAPDQADFARRELLAEIQRIAENGIPQDAFERVRATALSGLALQQQSPASLARHTALDLLFGHPADQHRLLPAIYQNLTSEAVRETAARILDHPPTSAVILPDEASEDA
jgi:zinc protease